MATMNRRRGAAALALSWLAVCAAPAQYSGGFEAPEFSATPAGTSVVGQGTPAWFLPPVGGNDGLVYRFDGNSLGIIPNCEGGGQFLAAQRRGGGFTRAEVGSAGQNIWGPDGSVGLVRLQFDINCLWQDIGESDPDLPGIRNNLGSISIQPYPSSGVSLAMLWQNPGDPLDLDQPYQIGLSGFFADGTQAAGGVVQFPGTAFQGLSQNQWYRVWVDIDFDLNVVQRMTICGLTAELPDGLPASVDLGPNVAGAMWYLGGGEDGGGSVVGLRLFAGGGSGGMTGAGNTLAVDNVSTTLEPIDQPECVPCEGGACGPPCPQPGCNDDGIDCDLNNDCVVDLADLAVMLLRFGNSGSCADGDADGDGDVQLDDLAHLLLRFGRVCDD